MIPFTVTAYINPSPDAVIFAIRSGGLVKDTRGTNATSVLTSAFVILPFLPTVNQERLLLQSLVFHMLVQTAPIQTK